MLPNKPSHTAILIAGALLTLSRLSSRKSLVPEQHRKILEKASPLLQSALGPLSFLLSRKLTFLPALLEAATIPGLMNHFAVRKKAIAELLQRRIERTPQQVIIIAAGLDLLGTTLLSANPTLQVIEIDHPATQAFKREILQSAGAPLPHLIPADLSQQRLVEVIQEDTFVRRESSTTLIVEGLTMYLTERAVHELLITHSYFSASDVAWIGTAMLPNKNGKIQFQNHTALASLWLRFAKEQFTWGIPPEDLRSLAPRLGLILNAVYAGHALKALAGVDPKVTCAEGEYLFTASPPRKATIS